MGVVWLMWWAWALGTTTARSQARQLTEAAERALRARSAPPLARDRRSVKSLPDDLTTINPRAGWIREREGVEGEWDAETLCLVFEG